MVVVQVFVQVDVILPVQVALVVAPAVVEETVMAAVIQDATVAIIPAPVAVLEVVIQPVLAVVREIVAHLVLDIVIAAREAV